MADDLSAGFQASPSFANPAYATPSQLATARAYAAELMKRSGENVTRPAGAVANFIDAINAGLTRNNANQTEQQAAQNNASRQAQLFTQMQSGKPIDPQNAAAIYADPMASPETRGLVTALMKPEPIKSEYGQPAYQSPAGGVQAAPINGAPNQAFTPGYRASQAAPGISTDQPYPAPGVPLPAPRPDPTSPQGGTFGGMNSKPVNWDNPAVGPNGAPTRPLSFPELADTGRKIAAQNTFSQGNAEAQTNLARQDFDAAANAPAIKSAAGVMLDDLKTHGDKMTFGPTAEMSNNIKRVAANYAPGLMKDQLDSLASADSFDKMTSRLTSMLSKGGGTDAQLFNNMKSVPGSHNSKEGAQALLQMVLQTADQQQNLRLYTQGARTPQEYEQLRNQFFAQNPVINPLTGNPISVDASRSSTPQGGGGARILSVRPAG